MSAIHTSVVSETHAYAHSSAPWTAGERQTGVGRLIYYLSGGGMHAFGRTLQQEIARRKHVRFLSFAAVLGVGWLIFLFI